MTFAWAKKILLNFVPWNSSVCTIIFLNFPEDNKYNLLSRVGLFSADSTPPPLIQWNKTTIVLERPAMWKQRTAPVSSLLSNASLGATPGKRALPFKPQRKINSYKQKFSSMPSSWEEKWCAFYHQAFTIFILCKLSSMYKVILRFPWSISSSLRVKIEGLMRRKWF